MTAEKLLELYKEFYFREDEAQINLATRLQLPSTGVGPIISSF